MCSHDLGDSGDADGGGLLLGGIEPRDDAFYGLAGEIAPAIDQLRSHGGNDALVQRKRGGGWSGRQVVDSMNLVEKSPSAVKKALQQFRMQDVVRRKEEGRRKEQERGKI